MYKYSIKDTFTGETMKDMTSREMYKWLGLGSTAVSQFFKNGDQRMFRNRYLCERTYIGIESSKGMSTDQVDEFITEWRQMQKLFGVGS